MTAPRHAAHTPFVPTAGFLRDVVRPFSGAPLAFVAVVTPLLWIAENAGMLGLFLLLILSSWIWVYAYLLVEALAHGLPVPVLSIEMANPWHQPRPFLHLLALAAVAAGTNSLAHAAGPLAATAVALLAFTAFPASLALLAVDGELVMAFWPPALLRVARGLGGRYLWVVALSIAYPAGLWALGRWLPSILCQALGQFALFSLASALGGAMHARRHELGLDAWCSDERETERATLIADASRDRTADEIYGLLRAKRPADAWSAAERWTAGEPERAPALRWLRDRGLVWEERAWTARLDTVLVSALIAGGRRGEALAEVEAAWRRDGRCGPWPADQVAALVRAAHELGRPAVAARLEAEFSSSNG